MIVSSPLLPQCDSKIAGGTEKQVRRVQNRINRTGALGDQGFNWLNEQEL